MRRRFNIGERVALFIYAQGRCTTCGELLTTGWHADHVKPHSKGGETKITNGQALCARDNLKKGDRE